MGPSAASPARAAVHGVDGRLHGFESLEERSLLLALDFAGSVEEVLPQPFRLRFETAAGEFRDHVPDFLVVLGDGSRWLFDVRPAELFEEKDAASFAAAAEAALEAGWRYSVVAGWRPLPRSLVPLPGESLTGFILRLSFRLNQPPARIAEVTGLARDRPGGTSLPAALLTGVPEPASGEFTRLTRLTRDQATGLGLASWRERYPLRHQGSRPGQLGPLGRAVSRPVFRRAAEIP